MPAFLSVLFLAIISQTRGAGRNGSEFRCINYEINSDQSAAQSSQICPHHHPAEVGRDICTRRTLLKFCWTGWRRRSRRRSVEFMFHSVAGGCGGREESLQAGML